MKDLPLITPVSSVACSPFPCIHIFLDDVCPRKGTHKADSTVATENGLTLAPTSDDAARSFWENMFYVQQRCFSSGCRSGLTPAPYRLR